MFAISDTKVLGPQVNGIALTLPPASLITNTQPPLATPAPLIPVTPSISLHRLYKVLRLAPSCSKLNTSFHSAAICIRGGISSRTSSARSAPSNCADWGVDDLYPERTSGVKGGGWKGDVDLGGVGLSSAGGAKEAVRLEGLKLGSREARFVDDAWADEA